MDDVLLYPAEPIPAVDLHDATHRAELNAIYSAAPLGLVVLDTDLRFLRINKVMADINGLPIGAHLGKSVRDVIPSVADQAERVLQTLLETGRPVRIELKGETSQQPGVQRIWDERWSPLKDENGKVRAIAIIAEEVTELRETRDALRLAQARIREHAEALERTVEERTARLQETVQELEAFSYSIAHDMRAPLRAMIGYADLVAQEHAAAIDDTGREYLRRIAVSSLRLDRLIQDVLSYAHLVRDQLPVEPVDPGPLAHEIIESYPKLAAVRHRIQIEPSLPQVTANRSALTQVFANLLDNAVKFVAENSEPSVRVQGEGVTAPEGRPGGAWVRITVQDHGIGLDPEVRDKIFELFGGRRRRGLDDGLGMGLAITAKAVDRMGGVIGVDSVPGKGSGFWFVLPASVPAGELPLHAP